MNADLKHCCVAGCSVARGGENRVTMGGGEAEGVAANTRHEIRKKTTDDFSFFLSAGEVATGSKTKLAAPVCIGTKNDSYGTKYVSTCTLHCVKTSVLTFPYP
jgi:hypothetical protein